VDAGLHCDDIPEEVHPHEGLENASDGRGNHVCDGGGNLDAQDSCYAKQPADDSLEDRVSAYSLRANARTRLTVIRDPHKKVVRALLPVAEKSGVLMKAKMSGPSPASRMRGKSNTELKTLLYHDSSIASPLTTSRLFLMTTA